MTDRLGALWGWLLVTLALVLCTFLVIQGLSALLSWWRSRR